VPGETYLETGYLIVPPWSFPADGEEHTVVIDYEKDNRGRIRLWIDLEFIAEGVQSSSGMNGWAGTDNMAYGLATTSGVVVGATKDGWPGVITEDLLIYSGTLRVGGCASEVCVAVTATARAHEDEDVSSLSVGVAWRRRTVKGTTMRDAESPQATTAAGPLLTGLTATAGGLLAAGLALLAVRERRRRQRQAAVMAEFHAPQSVRKPECVFAATSVEQPLQQHLAAELCDVEKGEPAARDESQQP